MKNILLSPFPLSNGATNLQVIIVLSLMIVALVLIICCAIPDIMQSLKEALEEEIPNDCNYTSMDIKS